MFHTIQAAPMTMMASPIHHIRVPNSATDAAEESLSARRRKRPQDQPADDQEDRDERITDRRHPMLARLEDDLLARQQRLSEFVHGLSAPARRAGTASGRAGMIVRATCVRDRSNGTLAAGRLGSVPARR